MLGNILPDAAGLRVWIGNMKEAVSNAYSHIRSDLYYLPAQEGGNDTLELPRVVKAKPSTTSVRINDDLNSGITDLTRRHVWGECQNEYRQQVPLNGLDFVDSGRLKRLDPRVFDLAGTYDVLSFNRPSPNSWLEGLFADDEECCRDSGQSRRACRIFRSSSIILMGGRCFEYGCSCRWQEYDMRILI